MGKLMCKCGNRISDNSVGSTLMAMEGIEAENCEDENLFGRLCSGYMVFECDECGRVALVQVEENKAFWYKPEHNESPVIK